MERVVVFHPGAIGDVLLLLPYLFELHNRRIVISFYTQSWLTELHNIFKFIDEWHSLENGNIHKLFGRNFNPAELRWSGDYSKIIALFKQEGEIKNNLLKLKVPFICNSFIPPPNFKKHVTEHLSEIFGFTPRTDFARNKNTFQKTGTIIIHPGSGHRLKNWKLENFIKLADELKKMGERVMFLLGPAEIQISDSLKNAGETFFSTERLSDVYKLLGSAKLYIGNDSGITHLSAITGTRTVVIFGPTDPVVWRPLGVNVSVVTLPSCFPCIFRDNIIKCNDNKPCMPSFNEVYRTVRMILSEND